MREQDRTCACYSVAVTGDGKTITSLTVEDAGDAAALGPALILLFECHRPHAGSSLVSLANRTPLVFGRGDARTIERRVHDGKDVRWVGIPDGRASTVHASLERAGGRWLLTDLDSKNGTIVNGEGIRRRAVGDGDVIEIGHTFFLFRDASVPPDTHDLVRVRADTLVPALAETYRQLERIAQTTSTVVLEGESGTGKEVLAQRVHDRSGRDGRFVAVNCGALPDGLVESELFGHKQGAFSGALADRLGHVRSADGGTLLLDEIGDLPLPSQAALLRVLEQREVVPVGDSTPAAVDLRVIAATHRDLDALVASDDFRADLLARLADFRVRVPALRERREDLGILLAALMPEGAQLTRKVARALLAHAWPMNVRELKKCIETGLALAGGEPLAIEHLPASVTTAPASAPTGDDVDLRAQLDELLAKFNGNVSAVARALDKARPQVHRLLKRFDLDPNRYRR